MEYLESLPVKDWAKVTRSIDLLAEHGPELGEPYVKQVGEFKELRTCFGGKNYRVFFFQDKHKLVLVHAILKTTKKTPQSDIRLVKQRIADYRQRNPKSA